MVTNFPLIFNGFYVGISIHISCNSLITGAASKRKTLDWPTRLSIALGAARGKYSVPFSLTNTPHKKSQVYYKADV